MSRAFVFPGQGSQAVGMGKALADAMPAARLVFEEVDEALKQKLSRLMFEGPMEELTLTENAQPALMAVSIAVLRVLEQDLGVNLAKDCRFVAGHSLGEYSALCAARALPLDVAARLLKRRGQAMQQAVPVGQGAMAALLGLDLETARAVARDAAQGEVCDPANDNAPGQVVVSGHKSAVERAVDEFEAEQALALERAGQHQLRGLLRRKAEAGVIGRVAEQQHGAVAAGRRLSERMRRQRRAKAQASGRRDPPPAARASAPGRPRR